METDIMRMQREAEQRVRELREQERRAAHTGEPAAARRRGWPKPDGMDACVGIPAALGIQGPPYATAAGGGAPKPEPIQEIAKCPPEKRGDGGLLSAFGSDPEQLFLLLLAFYS